MSGHDLGAAKVEELVVTILSRASSADRFLLGLAGTPGSGKSTLAAYLRWRLELAPIVEMDGFHLSNAELELAGMLHRKGAIETFDGHGLLGLLRRLRCQREDESILAPRFDRSSDSCIPEAVPIEPSDRIVIIEGNYLLSTVAPWTSIRQVMDLCVFLEVDPATRRQRLIRRHMSFGRSNAEAAHFVQSNDERNAAMIEQTRQRADLALEIGHASAVQPPDGCAIHAEMASLFPEEPPQGQLEGS